MTSSSRHSGGPRVVFNPMTTEFRRDPYATYRRLREQDPVHWNGVARAWLVFRHRDVDTILRDHDRFSSNLHHDPLRQADDDIVDTPSMLMLDPPEHTRLRALITHAFARRALVDIRPRIETLCDQLLAPHVARADAFDLVTALAKPLPLIVIAEMLGVSTADHARFNHWSRLLGQSLLPRQTADLKRQSARADKELAAYFREVIAARRARPGPDLISALIAVEQAGDRMTEAEMLAMLRLLLIAGHETTSSLISNGVHALLTHPEQWEMLCERPALADSAVKETLRYDAPVQATRRIALVDTTIGAVSVQRGQRVFPMIGAANRDPAVFARPAHFDITRTQSAALAFGRGIHRCVGATLAHMEGTIALAHLARHVPGLRLTEDRPLYRKHLMLRGLETLRVRVC